MRTSKVLGVDIGREGWEFDGMLTSLISWSSRLCSKVMDGPAGFDLDIAVQNLET